MFSTAWPATPTVSPSPTVAFKDDRVSFRWKDYAAGGKQKVMNVSAEEFLRVAE
jgi:hypothetical protein